jgi:ATP-binding cassette subfamily C protein CydC/ATP-binding cassette subfamily C protein CydCD
VNATLRRLVALAGVPRAGLALSVALGGLVVLFGVGLMTSAGYLISRAAEHPPILSLTVTIVAVRFFGLARPAARYLERLASHDVALRSLGQIRARFYRRLEPLAPGEVSGYRSGDLLARMVGDVDALQGLYLRGLAPPLVALVAASACVGVATAVLPVAGLVLATGLLTAGVAVPALAALQGRHAGGRQAAARGELTAELVELQRGAPELVLYGREEDALARVRRADAELVRLGRRDALTAGLADGLSILVTGATVAGVLAVAVAAPVDRVLVATLALLALASFEAVAPLAGAARELSGLTAAGRRVLEVTDRVPAIRDPGDPASAPAALPLALESVTAGYAEEQPVLRDVGLRLEPGRKVALVGPSGAGKTTVTRLLLRFLDPVAGRVSADGRDVRDHRQADVRRLVALAGQEAHLFATTIRNNLLLARPGASDAELEDTLVRVRLADWVASLPDGLDTVVGEEGSRLSGGQRQRLVLARALLAETPVLVLDEPTAHLDATTAEALMDDVLEAADDRAVLLVTHRPEGLEHMDEIVTLADRRVVAA